MKAGIVLYDWKLPTFRRILTEAGYTYTDAGGLTHDTTVLIVETNDILKLEGVIERCQKEAEKEKPRGK